MAEQHRREERSGVHAATEQLRAMGVLAEGVADGLGQLPAFPVFDVVISALRGTWLHGNSRTSVDGSIKTIEFHLHLSHINLLTPLLTEFFFNRKVLLSCSFDCL